MNLIVLPSAKQIELLEKCRQCEDIALELTPLFLAKISRRLKKASPHQSMIFPEYLRFNIIPSFIKTHIDNVSNILVMGIKTIIFHPLHSNLWGLLDILDSPTKIIYLMFSEEFFNSSLSDFFSSILDIGLGATN